MRFNKFDNRPHTTDARAAAATDLWIESQTEHPAIEPRAPRAACAGARTGSAVRTVVEIVNPVQKARRVGNALKSFYDGLLEGYQQR